MTDLYVVEGQFTVSINESTFRIDTPRVNHFKVIDEKEKYFNVMILGVKTRVYKDKHENCIFKNTEDAKEAIRVKKRELIDKVSTMLEALKVESFNIPMDENRPNNFTL